MRDRQANINQHRRKWNERVAKKAELAQHNLKERAKRSSKEQTAELDKRLVKGLGAVKERKRLESI